MDRAYHFLSKQGNPYWHCALCDFPRSLASLGHLSVHVKLCHDPLSRCFRIQIRTSLCEVTGISRAFEFVIQSSSPACGNRRSLLFLLQEKHCLLCDIFDLSRYSCLKTVYSLFLNYTLVLILLVAEQKFVLSENCQG